ncbi:MAG: AAA family ATPase [Mycoplasmataceae bacterium]|nr:AAA family ATPase [Mycoplasmataceae bacterium]
MIIKYIGIENFGVFSGKSEFNFETSKTNLIIGENGSGKSTILFLLNFLLDPKIRKNGLKEEWINTGNRKSTVPSIIEFKFCVRDIAILSTLAIVENDEIYIKMEILFEAGEYNVYFYIGETEKLKFDYFRPLPFDKYINVLFIKDSIFEDEGVNLIKTHINENESKESIINLIDSYIEESNINISEISEIKNINNFAKNAITNIFDDDENFSIKITSNIKFSNKFNKLKFQPINKLDEGQLVTHGSGFEKIFSLLSLIKTLEYNETKIILLWDEPENNLFFTYQKKIIEFIKQKEETIICSVFATHSPNIVELLPGTSISKIYDNKIKTFHIGPNEHYYSYQADLSKHIFYDYVVLLEGHSEKMFFEYISNQNQYIKNLIKGKSISFLNIQGTHFKEIYNLLSVLCKKVIVLTDNDIFSNKMQGYYRLIQLIPNNVDILKITKDGSLDFLIVDENNVDAITIDQKNMCTTILKTLNKNGLYIPENFKDSFEEELKKDNLIDDNELKSLKNSKLKKLSEKIDTINQKINLVTIQNSNYLFKWLKDLNE